MTKLRDEVWTIIGRECDSVDIYSGVDTYRATTVDVPPKSLDVFLLLACDAEIRNGGFRQLFRNSTGMIVLDAVPAYRRAGLDFLATIVEAATRMLGDHYEVDQQTRRDLVTSLERSDDDPKPVTEYDADINAVFNRLQHKTHRPRNKPFKPLDRSYYSAADSDAVLTACFDYLKLGG